MFKTRQKGHAGPSRGKKPQAASRAKTRAQAMKFDELNNISGQNRLKFKRQAPSRLHCTQAVAQGRNLALGPPARASSLLKLSPVASFTGGAFCEILAKMAKFRDKF